MIGPVKVNSCHCCEYRKFGVQDPREAPIGECTHPDALNRTGMPSDTVLYLIAGWFTPPQLFDLIGSDGDLADAELDQLIDLARRTVHEEFLLQKVLRRGVAFHYGNLPLLIRNEIERLFSTGTIRYLICTSTLVEGVNMSCRNIFLRGPKKGIGHPMSADDFWNLAGRAGRWGKEFQGNIVCIDALRTDVWGLTDHRVAGLTVKFDGRRT